MTFMNLTRKEAVQAWLSTAEQYPMQIVQSVPIEINMLLDNIGALQFDELLAEISYCTKHGLEIDRDWEAKVCRGNSTRDADSKAGVFLLFNLAMETARSIHPHFFPYAITRTPAKRVICYHRLQGMQLAEYAAELISLSYKRPKYLRDDEPISDADIIKKLGAALGGVSY